jgi:cytochrome P450
MRPQGPEHEERPTMSKSAEEILESLDLFADDQREHLLDAFDLARQKCPVVHTEADGGYHVVTRYDDVKTVCQKPDVFSSAQPGIRGVPVRLPPLDADLPLHRDFRRFLNQYFSRSFLLRYEDDMRTVARAAIVEFLDRGEVEFVHEFAIPFSAGSLARIVFATDNADLVARGVAAVHRTSVESTPETFTAVALLAMEAMAEVGDNPVGREDVLAGLVTAEVDGRPLTDEERLGVVTVLLLGGLDTTRGMITNIAFHLATRPGTEDLLQRPEWWRSDLDEFIRFEPTVSFMARTCTRDFELGGTQLKAGDRVVIDFTSANRDPDRFERPNELSFDRPSNPHAGFGMGIHRCLGLNFARLQITLAFDELLKVATNFRLAEGKPLPRQTGVTLNSPTEMHLVFDRR